MFPAAHRAVQRRRSQRALFPSRWFRHRRFSAATGFALRSVWVETYLRTQLALRFGRVCLFAGSSWRVCANRERRGAASWELSPDATPHDATTADVPVPNYVDELTGNIKGARLGLPRSLFGEGLDAEVRASVEAAVEVYRELGAEVVDIELPNAQYSIAVYYIIATAEASSNLARFDGVRYGFRAEEAPRLREMYRKTREEGFGAEVKRRIMLGTYVLSAGYYEAYYGKAQQVRALIRERFQESVRELRRDHHADVADAGVPAGRKS